MERCCKCACCNNTVMRVPAFVLNEATLVASQEIPFNFEEDEIPYVQAFLLDEARVVPSIEIPFNFKEDELHCSKNRRRVKVLSKLWRLARELFSDLKIYARREWYRIAII